MRSSADGLLKRHRKLIHSQMRKVSSHVQRQEGEWVINTLMIEGCDTPFRYKRQQRYRSLAGQRVNLTYYPDTVQVAGFAMEVMSVVRVKLA
ncbi:MAG: hypothetical protein ACQETD_04625 [Pseudomonadota bacterium]